MLFASRQCGSAPSLPACGALLFDIVDRNAFSAPAIAGRGTTGAREASEPWWRGRGTPCFVVVAKGDSDEAASLTWRRETSKLKLGVVCQLLRGVAVCAPSTTLLRRVVPLPPLSRGRKRKSAPENRGASFSPSKTAYAACFWSSRTLPLPIGIERGFLASGISRTRSTCRRPFSRLAPFTWTKSASWNTRSKVRAAMP